MAKGEAARRKEEDERILVLLQEKAQDVVGSDQRRFGRATSVAAARETLFMEHLRGALRQVFSQKLASPSATTKRKMSGQAKRIVNLVISDTHYGSNLDPREVPHRYGSTEEARRTAKIVLAAANYKRQYRDDTELYLHILGDIIQGQLHDMRDGLPLAEQVAAAMRILVQAVRFLAAQYPRGVTVFCTPGNHGRNTARHRERSVNQKWDSIETMIYVALKEASAHIPNVRVVLGYEPKYDFALFDAVALGTHGDTVINPGYPGKNIDSGGIKKQINDINVARVTRGKKPYRVVIMGHVHVGSQVHLPGGVIVLTNGCLIPPDAYANSIGIYDTSCGQWIFESTEDHPFGHSWFVEVDEHTDKDASLDAIIRPFTGL